MLPQAPVKNFQVKKSPKLSSELSGLQNEYQSSSQARQSSREKINLLYQEYLMIRGEHVLVELIAENSAETLLADMSPLDFEEVATYQRVISGWLNMNAIDQLNDINSLRFARAVRVPQKDIGAVTSQGDVAQGSSEARENFGVDGTGVNVGILSDSYNFLRGEDAGIASGDLPGPGNPEGYEQKVKILLDADVVADLNPYFAFSDEGRAMAEIVHDVAPGAKLAFHTAFLGQPSFASGILRLEDEANCDVIVDDVIYFEEPFFQDGIIAQAADEVSRRGATFLSSAGNRDRQSYESEFRPSESPMPLGTDPTTFGETFIIGEYLLHDFDPGPGVDYFQKVTFPGSLNLSFQWDNAYASACPDCPGAESDLDIFIALREDDFNSMHTLGINVNVGADPIETIGAVSDFPQDVYIVIGKWLGASGPNPNPSIIKYIDYGSGLPTEHATYSSTVVGHKNAEGAIAVGAVPYFLTPAFGFPDPFLEDFSSAGGTPIFYDQYGNRIKKELRMKPEICGPDGGNTTFFFPLQDLEGDGFPNFFGTSASSPHVAGVAALMQDATDHALDPKQVETVLTHTALDMDDPFTAEFDEGFDYGTGYGFVQSEKALEKAISSQQITRLVLVNADNDTDLRPLKEGDRILLSELGTNNLAIRAETDPATVGSVKIMISGAINTEQIENNAPYYSFADANGNANGKQFSLGSYSAKAVPYAGKGATGKMGLPLEINFQLIEKVESFTLIDAQADVDIENLSLYNILFPFEYNNQLNIRANTSSDSKVGSVKFVLRVIDFFETYEIHSTVENNAPFALFGDWGGGDYIGGSFESGLYILEATPYSGKNATGTPGERLSVILDVFNFALDQSAARTIDVYPNPISNQEKLQVDIKNAASEKAQFTLLNIRGETLYEAEQYVSGTISPANISINELNLQPGVYFLRVTLPNKKVETVRLLKK